MINIVIRDASSMCVPQSLNLGFTNEEEREGRFESIVCSQARDGISFGFGPRAPHIGTMLTLTRLQNRSLFKLI